MPVGAFGGRASVMDQLAPDGPIYQAGTLSGNPLAMSAGLATLNILGQPGFFERLENMTKRLTDGLAERAAAHGIPLETTAVGGMFGLFFTANGPIRYFEEVMACDVVRFKHFFHGKLTRGIYLAPSAFEAGFVSAMHGEGELAATLLAADEVFAELAQPV
jgi:glutamate-1-semialdehyde 2,1-aminomutase